MKRVISIVLTLVMILSVCSSLTFSVSAANDMKYEDVKYQVKSSGFKGDSITFDIYFAPNQEIQLAMVSVAFSTSYFKVAKAGPVMITDSDGNESEAVPGIHEHNISANRNSCYTFAYMTSGSYKIGSNAKKVYSITFKLKEQPSATQKFNFKIYNGTSKDCVEENLIKTFSEQYTVSLATPSVKVANTAKGIKVTWNKIANAQKYVVYQRSYNAKNKSWSGWKAIKTTTGLSYVDTTTKIGTIYRYTVKAVNGKTVSSFKSTGDLKYNVVPVVKVANAAGGVKVTWSTAANATGYTIYSSTYNTKTKKWSDWKARGTAAKNKTAWVDKAAKNGTYYKYMVRARYGSAASSYKASANILRLANPTVKAAKASNGIKITWNKIAGTKQYAIYRAEYVNGAWTGWSGLKTVAASTSAYVDKTAKKGKTYRYTVRAVNGSNKSAYTASASVKR